MPQRFWKEFLLAARFGIVGVLATTVHILLVWGMLHGELVGPQSANLLAFLGAFVVSFIGNYRFTFGSPGHWPLALRKFFATSLTAYGLNALTLASLLNVGRWTPMTCALAAAACVPVFSFAVSRCWAFRPPKSRPPDQSTYRDDDAQ